MKQENPFSRWNISTSSLIRSDSPVEASNRIFDDFAVVHPEVPKAKLLRGSKVFTMGSCFAREIESKLIAKGGTVVSMDLDAIASPAFLDGSDRGFRTGFFNRFTPVAMAQEFERSFDELDGWKEDSLLFERVAGSYSDLHYWVLSGMPSDIESALHRRNVARDLVRTAAAADLIVLTLGLIESWLHLPSGLHVNRIDPKVFARNKDQFALIKQSYADTLDCLTRIKNVLDRHHQTGKYQLVVTVSPVPMQSTFTSKDIVIANMDSKSTLRAAAQAFTEGTEKANYFPSFEMVNYSHFDLAWQADRTHVKPDMVSHIVKTFTETYYERGELS